MSLRFKLLSFAVAVGCASTVLSAAEIVVPNAYATTAAPGNNAYPFFAPESGSPQMRYQQVYGSDQFAGIGAGQYITDLKFRALSPLNGNFTSVIDSLKIFLGTTTHAVDQLDSGFAANSAAIQDVVYNGAFRATGVSSNANPTAFNYAIHLQTPYFYNPSNGNLLMELQIINGSGTDMALNSVNVVGDSVARLVGKDAYYPIGFIDTSGLVTDFVTSTTPEPGMLGAFALAGLLLARRPRD